MDKPDNKLTYGVGIQQPTSGTYIPGLGGCTVHSAELGRAEPGMLVTSNSPRVSLYDTYDGRSGLLEIRVCWKSKKESEGGKRTSERNPRYKERYLTSKYTEERQKERYSNYTDTAGTANLGRLSV